MKRYGKTEIARRWMLDHMSRMKEGDRMMIVHPNADHTIITRNGNQIEEKKDNVKKTEIRFHGLGEENIRENHNPGKQKSDCKD